MASYILIVALLTCTITLLLMISEGIDASWWCFGDDLMIDEKTLRNERLPVDERVMRRVYVLIDKHLSRKIVGDDVQKNMREIRWLLRNEIEAKEGALCAKLPGRSCISKQYAAEQYQELDISHRNEVINALLRLNDLAKIAESKLPTSIVETNQLIENNRIANDSFARWRENVRDGFLPRLDSLMMKIAIERTAIALPEYRKIIHTISTLRAYEVIHQLWDAILEKRLGKDVDLFFSEDPAGALINILRMPNSFEENELRIFNRFARFYNKYLHLKGSTRDVYYRFNMLIKQPCLDYMDIVANLITSVRFSMKFRDYLSKETLQSIDRDILIYKVQAYHWMCRRLIKDEDKFISAFGHYLIEIKTQRIVKFIKAGR